MKHIFLGMACCLCLAVLLGCGGTTRTSGTSLLPANNIPASSHVVLVVEENHSYEQVIGNSDMPYLNSLAMQYALATQYFADAHPSIPNYFMLTTGNLETVNDSFTGTISDDNLAREITAAGKSWHVYAEDLPNAGYLDGDTASYVKRHNPFAYFNDVVNSPTQAANLLPFSQFATDLSGGTLPNFSFIVPNLNNDAHNGTLADADSWLKSNIAPLLSNPQFQQDGLLIVVFDEGADVDVRHIGGQVAAILAGPKVKPGYRSTTEFQHESTLRLIEQVLGIRTALGNASGANPMGEFFQ